MTLLQRTHANISPQLQRLYLPFHQYEPACAPAASDRYSVMSVTVGERYSLFGGKKKKQKKNKKIPLVSKHITDRLLV